MTLRGTLHPWQLLIPPLAGLVSGMRGCFLSSSNVLFRSRPTLFPSPCTLCLRGEYLRRQLRKIQNRQRDDQLTVALLWFTVVRCSGCESAAVREAEAEIIEIILVVLVLFRPTRRGTLVHSNDALDLLRERHTKIVQDRSQFRFKR